MLCVTGVESLQMVKLTSGRSSRGFNEICRPGKNCSRASTVVGTLAKWLDQKNTI